MRLWSRQTSWCTDKDHRGWALESMGNLGTCHMLLGRWHWYVCACGPGTAGAFATAISNVPGGDPELGMTVGVSFPHASTHSVAEFGSSRDEVCYNIPPAPEMNHSIALEGLGELALLPFSTSEKGGSSPKWRCKSSLRAGALRTLPLRLMLVCVPRRV